MGGSPSRADIERISRLTPLQEGMFFEALRKQGSGEVIYQVCLELTGAVPPETVRQAWRLVTRHHPILRTSFHYERLDTPVQIAWRSAEAPWQELDWRDLGAEERERRIVELVDADRHRPFTLTRAPLMRLTLVRITDQRSWLVWTYHHLLLDGWSTYLVLDDVSRACRELTAGGTPQLPVTRPYWEYVAWVQGRGTAEAETYWRRRLAGFTAPTPLGYEETDPPAAEFDEIVRTLDESTGARLAAAAAGGRVTLGTLVQAGWAVTLSRYAGQADVVFGTVVSGRPPEFAGIDEMVGLFINVLPARVTVDDRRPLAQWLVDLQQQLADDRQYEYTPLSMLQRWSELPRGLPLFESLAVFINYPVRDSWGDGGEVQVTGQRVLQQPHYPLHLTVVAGAPGWRLTIGYDPGRFRRATVDRIADLLLGVLEAMVGETAAVVGELPRWTATAPLAVLADPAVADEPPPAVTVPDLFQAVVAQQPHAPAVAAGAEVVSFAALRGHVAEAAGRLTAAGVTAGTPVELVAADSGQLAVGLLAAASVGAPVRLRPAARPGDRQTVTVEFPAGAGAQARYRPRVTPPTGESAPAATSGAGAGGPTAASAVLELPDQPDAVSQLTHAGLVQLWWWLQSQLPLSRADRVWCAGATTSFATVRDVLWALCAGATVVTGPVPGGRPGTAVPVPDEVTVAWVPTGVAVAAAERPATLPGTLRRLCCGPGPLPARALARLTSGDLEVIEERPAGPALSSCFYRRGWPAPRTSPPVGRRIDRGRVFPAWDGRDLAPADARLWAVEAVLAQHPGVREAAAVTADRDGRLEVVAYLVPGAAAASAAELAELVAARLGRALAPTRFVTVEELPRTATGHLDPAALPGQSGAADDQAGPRAADPLVELVTGCWATVFGLRAEQVGYRADFFDLGGHSLLAIRLVSRLRAATGADFTLNHLFADSTVAGSVRAIRGGLESAPEPAEVVPIRRVPRDPPPPLSFGQERLWFLEQVATGPPNNILLPTRVAGRVEADLLRQALAALVRRHEVLRSCLPEREGRPVQVVLPDWEPPLSVDDLSGLPRDVAERQARALLEADAATRFDLVTSPPVRARLIRLTAAEHVIGVCVHHTAFDGWSTGVLFGDLNQLYRALAEGGPPSLPELPVQYADYAVWQRDQLSPERLDRLTRYWRTHLDGAAEVLDLAGDRPEPGGPPGTGGFHEVTVSAELVGDLAALATAEGCTVSMAFLAGYALLLGRRAGRADPVVGMPVAGRDRPETERLIGFFVNTLPLRIDLTGRPTYRELLHRVRTVCLGGLAHADLPFERLVTQLRPARRAERLPVVQVVFNFQSVPYTPLAVDGGAGSYFPVRQDLLAQYDLSLEVSGGPHGARCGFHFAADRYPPRFVAEFGEEYVDLLRQLTTEPDAARDWAVPGGDRRGPVDPDTLSRSALRAVAGTGAGGAQR